MDDLVVRCLGVGDGTDNADRNHSAYLYESAGASVLIDCGEPVSRTLKASGLAAERIDHLVLSHLHSDHFGGLFMLLQSFWLERRGKELPVSLPADGIAPVRAMIEAAYLFPELLPFPVRLEPLRDTKTFAVGDIQITPWRTSHLDQLRRDFQAKHPGDYAAFCFLLETGGRRIGHSADLGRPEDLEPLLAAPLDLLVCELAHFPPENLFAYLRGRAFKRLALIHLDRRWWEDQAAVLRLAASQLPGIEVVIPRDGDVVCV